jgi:hypothetical protein
MTRIRSSISTLLLADGATRPRRSLASSEGPGYRSKMVIHSASDAQ